MFGLGPRSKKSSGGNHSGQRRRSKSRINDRIDEDLNKPEDTRLGPDDKDRMVYNPGKSLKSSTKDIPYYLRNTSLNSFAFFVLSYLAVYFPGKIASAVLADLSNRGPVIFYHKILFTNITGWESSDAISIFSAPLVVNFIQFVLYFSLFHWTKQREGPYRQFAFWLFLHSMMRAWGSVLPGIAAFEEFGYLAGWLYLNSSIVFGLSMVSIGVLFLLSSIWVLFALETSYSKHLVYKEERLKYLHFFVGLPVLAGSLFILLLHTLSVDFFLRGSGTMPRLGDSMHEMVYLAEFGIVYLAMMMFLPFYREKEFIIVRDLRMLKPQRFWILAALGSGLAFRLFLDKGWFW
ncbi:MAG: hypothetical protein EBR22_04125 [Cytophagia bacterium]|nr:hypothetical protein [Cytophagia bacterium]